MDFLELKASMRSRIWDTMNNNDWKELDDFSLRLSDKLAKRMIARRAIYLGTIVSSIRTNFFSVNSISRKMFIDELKVDLHDLIELFRPVKRGRISKPKHHKDVPRIDFSDEVKRQVLRNQDHCCAKCGNLLGILEWDHKDGDRSNNDISNARALCPICHGIVSRKRQMGIKLSDDDV